MCIGVCQRADCRRLQPRHEQRKLRRGIRARFPLARNLFFHNGFSAVYITQEKRCAFFDVQPPKFCLNGCQRIRHARIRRAQALIHASLGQHNVLLRHGKAACGEVCPQHGKIGHRLQDQLHACIADKCRRIEDADDRLTAHTADSNIRRRKVFKRCKPVTDRHADFV